MRDAQADVPWPDGFGRNLRSKTRWFTGFCNSHQVSHFATFFIDARAEISVAESRFDIQETPRPPTRAHRERGRWEADASFRFSLARSAPGFVGRHDTHESASDGDGADGERTRPRRGPRVVKHLFAVCFAGFDNDPSAGSPTETLLRLLLPLNDKVQWTSRDVAASEPPTSPRSEHFTGPFNR